MGGNGSGNRARGPARKGYWKKHKMTELGLERKCSRCQEFWPCDDEFFHASGNGFHSYCKACVSERCYELRNNKHGWTAHNQRRKYHASNHAN